MADSGASRRFYLVESCRAKCSATFTNVQYCSPAHTDPGGQEGQHRVYKKIRIALQFLMRDGCR